MLLKFFCNSNNFILGTGDGGTTTSLTVGTFFITKCGSHWKLQLQFTLQC